MKKLSIATAMLKPFMYEIKPSCNNIRYFIRVTNVKNRLLQNNILTAVTCWANSHLNTGAVAANSVAFFG